MKMRKVTRPATIAGGPPDLKVHLRLVTFLRQLIASKMNECILFFILMSFVASLANSNVLPYIQPYNVACVESWIQNGSRVPPKIQPYEVRDCEESMIRNVADFGLNYLYAPRIWFSYDYIEGCFYAASKLCIDSYIPHFLSSYENKICYRIFGQSYLAEAVLYGINEHCASLNKTSHFIPILKKLQRDKLGNVMEMIRRRSTRFYKSILASQLIDYDPMQNIRSAIKQQNSIELIELLVDQEEVVKLEALLRAIKEGKNDMARVIRRLGSRLQYKLRKKLFRERRWKEYRLVLWNAIWRPFK